MIKNILILLFIGTTLLFSKIESYTIAKIPEASGIDYCEGSDTLVVTNDEGWLYEIKTNGEIINKKHLGKYDLEGVVCEKKRFVFAAENRGFLLVDRSTNKKKLVKLDSTYQGKKIKILDKSSGIEGITKVGKKYYLAKQAKKKKDSFIAVVKLDRYHTKIVDIIKHKVADTAGLAYHNDSLYLVSDKKDLLIRYDIKKEKIQCKLGLEKFAQEGIAFDASGHVYFADDDGAVLKYAMKDFGAKCAK